MAKNRSTRESYWVHGLQSRSQSKATPLGKLFGARGARETGLSLESPGFWKGVRAWVQQASQVAAATVRLSPACLYRLGGGKGWRWGVGWGRVLGPDTPPPTLKRASLRRTATARARGDCHALRSPQPRACRGCTRAAELPMADLSFIEDAVAFPEKEEDEEEEEEEGVEWGYEEGRLVGLRSRLLRPTRSRVCPSGAARVRFAPAAPGQPHLPAWSRLATELLSCLGKYNQKTRPELQAGSLLLGTLKRVS